MSAGPPRRRATLSTVAASLRGRRATAALEFGLVAWPFFYVLLVILQMGLYYMTQAALDAAVNGTANDMRNSFNSASAPTLPTGSALKSSIVNYGGGLISNSSSLAVDLRALTNLDSGIVPISDGTVDAITTSVPIVLRAQFNVVIVAPGFSTLSMVESAAVLRFDAF